MTPVWKADLVNELREVSHRHKPGTLPKEKSRMRVSRASGEEEERLEDDLDGQLHVELLAGAKSRRAVEVADGITDKTTLANASSTASQVDAIR